MTRSWRSWSKIFGLAEIYFTQGKRKKLVEWYPVGVVECRPFLRETIQEFRMLVCSSRVCLTGLQSVAGEEVQALSRGYVYVSLA